MRMPSWGWMAERWRQSLRALLLGLAFSSAVAADVHDFDFGDRLFESVGDDDDIPYGVVTRILQEPSGLFWIGTQNGLLRFDGYRFRRYVHDPRDPGSLSGDFVQTLAVDARGRLWVGTEADGVPTDALAAVQAASVQTTLPQGGDREAEARPGKRRCAQVEG